MADESVIANDAPDNEQPNALPAIEPGVYCSECTYDLRGVVSNRCPECGHSLENLRSTESGIPWVHRRERGLLKSYWRTVWMVTFRNQRFSEECIRPVSRADAQSFRWVTIAHVFVPVTAVVVTSAIARAPKVVGDPLRELIHRGPIPPLLWDYACTAGWPLAIGLALMLFFLIAATGVPSDFFRPRNVPLARQNAASTLSYYACGPLAAFAILVLMMLSTTVLLYKPYYGTSWRWTCAEIWELRWLMIILSAGMVAFTWWVNLVRTAQRAMPRVRRRATLIAVSVPLLWLTLAALIFVVPPFIGIYIVIIAASFG